MRSSPWLYAIGHPGEFYKVGFSANLHQRFQDIECSSPYFLQPASAWHVTDRVQALEFKVHEDLAKSYVCNEWFNCSLERVNDAVERQCKALEIGIVVRLSPFPIWDRPKRRFRPKTIKPDINSNAYAQMKEVAA